MTGEPVVRVEDLSKSFGGVKAVDGVSLEVREGEILGVIGPNGCGKTTLFNCILGQYRPDRGRVEIDGEDVSRWPPHRRARAGLARTFQLLQVFESMSVRDNLRTAAQEHIGSIGARLFRSPDMGLSDKVDRLIERFRLGHLADERAGNLSYGQQKLLDTAMAFVSDPAVVFLDEPAGGVNPTMLGDVRERIRDLFGRYVGPGVVQEALTSDQLGGEERFVAVLFVDLVGSTELAADRPPTEVVHVTDADHKLASPKIAAAIAEWIKKLG